MSDTVEPEHLTRGATFRVCVDFEGVEAGTVVTVHRFWYAQEVVWVRCRCGAKTPTKALMKTLPISALRLMADGNARRYG